MTEITDAIRAGVLGALSRGMSLDYAARADGIRVSEAEAIARAAGWPDNPQAVITEARRLRGVPRGGLPLQHATGQPGVDNRVEPELGVQRRPRGPQGPRPDLSVARVPGQPLPALVAHCGLCRAPLAECPGHEPPISDELAQDFADLGKAFVEYLAEPIAAQLADELQLPAGHQIEFDTTPILGSEPSATGHIHDRVCAEEELFCPDNRNGLTPGPGPIEPLRPAVDVPATPVKRSATRPGTLPCLGCGRGVTVEFVNRTGNQLHGNCREES